MSFTESNYKKDNLKILYEMCLREFDLVRKNIELFTRKVKDAYIDVLSALENSYGTEDCLVSYDNTLTDLSQLSATLRKFNLKFELTTLFKHIAINDEFLVCAENIFETEAANQRSERERFTYPQPNVDKYKPNYKATSVITYVKDSDKLLFYINETENPEYREFIRSLQNYFSDSPQALLRVPREGEVFGLHLEGYMFRAVRENGPVTDNEFDAYLLDFGEVIRITKDMDLYILSSAHQEYYAQALLCKLKSVNSSTDINLKTYLEKHLYVNHKFIVKEKISNVLHVELLTKENTNPFRNTNSPDSVASQENHQDTLAKLITNPFRQFLCITSECDNSNEMAQSRITRRIIVKERHEETTLLQDSQDMSNRRYNNNKSSRKDLKKHRHNNLQEFLDSNSGSFNSDEDDGCSTSSSRYSRSSHTSRSSRKSLQRRKFSNNEITEEDRKMLYEEPLNTTNAMKAVMGYEPKDDRTICPFTKPGEDSCFKGSRCRFSHVQKFKDGWTRDQAETIIDIPNKIEYLCNGQTIIIRPTHIVNVEFFFAQIHTHQSRYEPNLKELILKMNAPEEVVKYKKYKRFPARFELVLAKYKDNMWYRAKVVNFIDDEKLKVFYVDYGNSDVLTLSYIRKWETKFDYLPLQAIPCRLAGVKEIRSKALDASEYLRSLLIDRNSTVKALVINNTDRLLVRLFFGPDNEDISEELIRIGYVYRCPITQADKGQLIPA